MSVKTVERIIRLRAYLVLILQRIAHPKQPKTITTRGAAIKAVFRPTVELAELVAGFRGLGSGRAVEGCVRILSGGVPIQ